MVTGSHSVVKLTVLVQWEVSLSEQAAATFTV